MRIREMLYCYLVGTLLFWLVRIWWYRKYERGVNYGEIWQTFGLSLIWPFAMFILFMIHSVDHYNDTFICSYQEVKEKRARKRGYDS